MVLTCIIISDELMSRKNLERLISKHSNLEIIGSFNHFDEVLEILIQKSIDLIFLDVEASANSTIGILEQSINLPQIIISSFKLEYQQTTKEYPVTDFLLKPISMPRFLQAIDKAIEIKRHNNSYKVSAEEIFIQKEDQYIRLDYNQILYFEMVDDFIKIVTMDDEHLVKTSMKKIMDKLNHPRFLKVHNSYIINLSKIKTLNGEFLKIGQNSIPISRSSQSLLMSKLNIL